LGIYFAEGYTMLEELNAPIAELKANIDDTWGHL
jgi:hypothetical protein